MTEPSEPTPPPTLTGYTLCWAGDILMIRPDGWVDYRAEFASTFEERSAIVTAVHELQPRAIILDMEGIEFMTAFLVGLIVRIARAVDPTHSRRRLVLIGVSRMFQDYLATSRLDKVLPVGGTESEALRLISTDEWALDGSQPSGMRTGDNRNQIGGICGG